ncbi:hypothetical protein Pelo_17231 [Pelomyxa schiedti]|nr:hypothetical protein Pelo_17231 [Pelomyxa schiedti]
MCAALANSGSPCIATAALFCISGMVGLAGFGAEVYHQGNSLSLFIITPLNNNKLTDARRFPSSIPLPSRQRGPVPTLPEYNAIFVAVITWAFAAVAIKSTNVKKVGVVAVCTLGRTLC